ncbi:hypothetical protein Vadar_000990 [Vaccinium darrowii]|uniref:Uncharacterized protein n=1 Tax=Vaccinium darrowii TaxID=229202 RepID=A0ACB7YIP9_9ERIC|nr:hypothetical protein Vadar_000990 [Vaccinium darrowii]
MHEYPLSIVDHIGFRRYSTALQPLFKVPCRNTIKSEIFKIYEYEKGKTMSLVVHNASRLAITTDMWTSSNQKKGFMAVTAHFIDDSWTLQSRILRLTLRDWLLSENAVVREMAKRMVEKFDKYWSVIHGVVEVSAVLDPRYKINVLGFYFSKLFPTSYKEEVDRVHALKEYQSPSSMVEGIGESSSQSTPVDMESMSQYDLYML